MAGQILKAAVRLLATTIAAFSFLAAQPQGIAAFSGTIAGGDSDSAMTGTGPTSPQPAAKIPGSGNGPVAPTKGGTGTGGGTRAGTGTGGTGTGRNGTQGTTADGTAGTTADETAGTTAGGGVAGTGPTATTTNTAETGTATVGTATTDTVATVTEDEEDDEAEAVLGVENAPTTAVAGMQQQGGALAGAQQQGGAVAGAQQQGGAVAGLQSLPSTSSPAGSPLGALTALAGALYAITRRSKS